MASSTERLLLFLRSLREEGLSVGVAEERDALRVLEILGLADREALKTGLCALLAKTPEEQEAFASQFDYHFVSLAQARQREIDLWNAQQLHDQQLKEADEALRYGDQPIPIRQELKDIYIQMSEEDKEKIKRYIDTFSENTTVPKESSISK